MEIDVIVIGSGPNGLSAAIYCQQQGLNTLVIEGKDEIGGGTRTLELTQPGFHHDICSAIHPMTVISPYLKTLPLQDFGLEWVHTPIAAAHPLEGFPTPLLYRSIEETAATLGSDEERYIQLMRPLVKDWDILTEGFLGPLRFPKHPLKMARFGWTALQPAQTFITNHFKEPQSRALWAGMAAHSMLPFKNISSAAIAIVLMASAHKAGWPFPKGGANAITKTMAGYFKSLGGTIQTGFQVERFGQLPAARAYLFDVAPKNLLDIAGDRLSKFYRWQLKQYDYGAGAFKVDFALNAPLPFKDEALKKAGTIHIGGKMCGMAAGEEAIYNGEMPRHPFILLAQHSRFDPTRAPEGKHTAWAYCHVPHNSVADMTETIENEIEKLAPGFKKTIIDKHAIKAAHFERFNPNIIGGDINVGAQKLSQIFTRPALRLSSYRTSAKDIYLCSSATPPGGGVHGMCGYFAGRRMVRDLIK